VGKKWDGMKGRHLDFQKMNLEEKVKDSDFRKQQITMTTHKYE
jgi:hypothetical protein